MRICIIGFGPAGIAATRHVMHEDRNGKHECIVFEQTGRLGGTWVYTDKVGNDEFGLPIHTSMYKNLRTNLPIQLMCYPDFPVPDQHQKSYLTYEEVLSFLELYVETFQLKKYVKFNHVVTRVHPTGDEWEVEVKDLKEDVKQTYIFDAIMVCNGHYYAPRYPNIEGKETFTGFQMHSHDYRKPDIFKNKKVIVVGFGLSGSDITLDIANTASQVIVSKNKTSLNIKNVFPKNVRVKCEIIKISGNYAYFEDGTKEEADAIMYCTGFKYTFPFLTKECGVSIVNNRVTPLYKHLINIEHPTLAIIGLIYYSCTFPVFDLQARFFLKTLEGDVKLPNKESMLEDTEKELQRKLKDGLNPTKFHMLGHYQDEYFNDLAKIGNVTPIPSFMTKLHMFCIDRLMDNVANFRNDMFKIIDDETFVKVN